MPVTAVRLHKGWNDVERRIALRTEPVPSGAAESGLLRASQWKRFAWLCTAGCDRRDVREIRQNDAERRIASRIDSLCSPERRSPIGLAVRKAVEERFAWSRAERVSIDRLSRYAGVPVTAMPSSELYLIRRGVTSPGARNSLAEPFAWRRAAERDRHRLRGFRSTESERRLPLRVDSLSTYEPRPTLGISASKTVGETFAVSCRRPERNGMYPEVLACA